MHHGALADPWQSHLEDFFQGSREHVHPGATAGNIRLLAGEPPAEGPPGPELGATVEVRCAWRLGWASISGQRQLYALPMSFGRAPGLFPFPAVVRCAGCALSPGSDVALPPTCLPWSHGFL